MKLSGTRSVAASHSAVWAALNDPAVIKRCAPGCESIEATDENAYRMCVAQQVGPVSARFTGTIRMVDIDSPNAYTLRFDGTAGAAGFVRGEARVRVAADGSDATTLSYEASAQVGGKLAQVGSRLIDSIAARVTDEFFTRFVAAVAAPAAAAIVEKPPAQRGLARVAIVAVAVVLLILLGVWISS